MKSGIVKSLILYFIGFSSTALIYFSTESHYAHGPNLYHLTFLLTIFIGSIWFLVATIIYLIKKKRNMLGYIIINGIATLSFLVYMWILVDPGPIPEPTYFNEDELAIARSGDSTLIFYNENLIYMRVADSIHFDFRDSTMMAIDLK